MIDKSVLRSTRTLFALVALTAMISTAAACSSDSDASDTPAADTTTTVPIGGGDSDDSSSDPAASDPPPADADSDADGDGSDDGASQEGSLPGDFPAIPLPDYDRVDVIGTGQMGSGQYSGRAAFVIEAYVDKPLSEMIDAYGEILVSAGFSPLELDDEGSRIRGWSTQGEGDSENQVDITVYKDRPGELEIGGAHWSAIGIG